MTQLPRPAKQSNKTTNRPREPRYSKPLPEGNNAQIMVPHSWDDLKPVPKDQCDSKYLNILEQCGFGHIQPVVPLKARYSQGRRWTREEFQACVISWKSGISLTLIAASLNRNPQDMIFRLLDYCEREGLEFTERGRSEGSDNWTPAVGECAGKLFEAGLPAWKIATLFQVDFEHVEKQLFLKRHDYGHRKKNPFGINTDHKHLINAKVLADSGDNIQDALDAFAGEGKTTTIIEDLFPHARILAVESDNTVFSKSQIRAWNSTTEWINQDNLAVISTLLKEGRHFDLVDLDPFVTCHAQLKEVWHLLRPQALLFVTFGGEYRRSFISSNRKAIASRYDFYNENLDNKTYLELVPCFFLGWIAHLAMLNCYTFSILRAVRYANNCRFWLSVKQCSSRTAKEWFSKIVTPQHGGFRFNALNLPRFAEVRHELDEKDQVCLF